MAHPEPEAWVRLMGVAFVERTETNFHVLRPKRYTPNPKRWPITCTPRHLTPEPLSCFPSTGAVFRCRPRRPNPDNTVLVLNKAVPPNPDTPSKCWGGITRITLPVE